MTTKPTTTREWAVRCTGPGGNHICAYPGNEIEAREAASRGNQSASTGVHYDALYRDVTRTEWAVLGGGDLL